LRVLDLMIQEIIWTRRNDDDDDADDDAGTDRGN
jgi:hypothetical protein